MRSIQESQIERSQSDDVGKRMLVVELLVKRPSGKPKKSFMDVVKEDTRLVCVNEKDRI